ncbi:hypothetical protein [Psychrobacter urativorans]|uniref:hypothetical protein n=1 Tax=Psychrobacter urativorans TaxID=45610 RepID=UPI001919A730|nr:hypothetical protein [Psychrobacter urativorans]
MRVKNAPRLRFQLPRFPCPVPASVSTGLSQTTDLPQQPLPLVPKHTRRMISFQSVGGSQQGAGTWLLALFVVAVLVTAIVGLMLGHKLGYQRGYYSLQNETKEAAVNNEQASKELKDLRISHKILTNQVATAKQELTISLTNLDELRQTQRALKVENKQVSQLNELYAKLLIEKGGMPLQVLGAKIDPLPESAFEYGFDVGMLSDDGQAKNLTVIMTLQDKDNFIEVPLDPANYVIEGIVRIRGRFVMPARFKPLQIKLSLEAGDQQVEQLYDWSLGDRVDDMPLSLLDLPEVDASPIAADKVTDKKETPK